MRRSEANQQITRWRDTYIGAFAGLFTERHFRQPEASSTSGPSLSFSKEKKTSQHKLA
jgi:hypothetical protein